MRSSLVSKLLCPGCYGALTLRKERVSSVPDASAPPASVSVSFSGEEELVYEGRLICGPCGVEYPVHLGVAALAVLDRAWAPILSEMVVRRIIREDALRPDIAPTKRDETRRELTTVTEDITDRLTRHVLSEIDFSGKPSILDLGGGGGATAKAFAERGADVVVVEPELDDLFQMHLKGYEKAAVQESFVKPDGEKIFKKWPDVFPGYFARIFAGGHRLPFTESAFDIVFCRAVLHHVSDMGGVLREMLRVTKPGGRIILCSEPNRSIFESESWHLVCDMDAHRGMNERRPRLLNYLLPLLRGRVRNLRVQYIPWGIHGATRRVMDFLHWHYEKHLCAEEWLTGWRILKLLPVSSAITLIAERTAAPVARPAADIRAPRALPDALIRLYSISQPFETLLKTLPEGTREIMRLRRKLLESSRDLAARLDIGASNRQGLSRGFGEPVQAGGYRVRPTLRRSGVTLRKKSGARRLGIFFVPLRAGAEYRVRVSVNDQPAAEFVIRDPGERWLDIAHILEPVIDVLLENEALYPETVAGREVESGVGVRWVRLG